MPIELATTFLIEFHRLWVKVSHRSRFTAEVAFRHIVMVEEDRAARRNCRKAKWALSALTARHGGVATLSSVF